MKSGNKNPSAGHQVLGAYLIPARFVAKFGFGKKPKSNAQGYRQI